MSACILFSGYVGAQTDNPYHINGNASQENCNCYTLTTDVINQSGSVWNINKINLTQPFDYHFNIYMGCKNDNGADGIAFVLQPISTSIGVAGEGLGIQGVAPSVAIAVDTYQNTNLGDPTYDHLSIHLNGDLSHNSSNNIGPPVTALANSDNIEDCAWHVLRISWDPVTTYLTVYMDNIERLKVTTDLVQNIFNNDPMVFWGFTGSTGSLSNHQRFCTSLNASFSLGENISTCYPEPILLQDSSTSFGTIVKWFWDFGDGTTDTVKAPAPHLYPRPGNYDVTLNILGNNGCLSDTFRQRIVAGSEPFADFDFRQPPYCDDKLIPFHDLSSVAFGTINQWLWLVDGNNSSLTGPGFFQQLTAGNHTVSLSVSTKEGCISSPVTKTIAISEHPEISMAEAMDACRDEPVLFESANIKPNIAIQQWFWNFGDHTTGGSASTEHTYKLGGDYNVQVYAMAENGCLSDTLEQQVSIFATNARAGNDTVIAAGQPLQLQATGGDYFEWAPSAGLTQPDIANPVATLQQDGLYTVTATSNAGCPTTDTIFIKVYKGPELYVPTAFTPNGDRINDVFRFTAAGMTDIYYFKIYNRYGQLVYNSTDPEKGWDGTWNGQPQANDTYVWMIGAKDYMGNIVNRKGMVTLIR
ncbi:MAG: gliding motility-associated C-terminal domain-containing protein [Chitinophagaceae bacterium]|nr:gliding motility-associated C-terminal domain-containing protein [Chitinophagaceae bacterium]